MEDNQQSLKLVESRDAMNLVPRWEAEAWWYFAGAGIIVFFLVLVFFIRRKKPVSDPSKEKREAYIVAKKELQEMVYSGRRETSGLVSLSLRKYLARSLNEPALYETQEEFVGRGESLKDFPEDMKEAVVKFFGKLAQAKYAADEPTAPPLEALVPDGLELLERIHKS